MRTAASRTYRTRHGYRTVFTTGATSYRASNGTYRVLPKALAEQTNGALADDQGSFSASLPATATGAVQASDAGAVFDSALVGASPVDATSEGTSAVYTDAYPSTNVTYSVGAANVDETLTLTGPNAPTSFAARVTVATGSELHLNDDNSISVLNSDGSVEATLPAPWMQDSSGNLDTDTSTAVPYTISGSSPNYTVTATPSASWLADPARVYPIVIDPTITFGGPNADASRGCYYTNPTGVGTAAGSTPSDPVMCSTTTGTDNKLEWGQVGHARRAFLQFPDIGATSSPIPADAVVTDATMTVTEKSSNNTSSFLTDVYRPNGTWSSSTTWGNGMPGSTGSLQDQLTVSPPGAGGTINFKPVNTVTNWVRGSVPNNGVFLRADDESSINNAVSIYGFANTANRPSLTVTWRPQVGQQPWVSTYDHKLSDRMQLHVDLPDRNLVLTNQDEILSSPGQQLTVTRTYNSRNAASAVNAAGAWGPGWSMDGGTDATLAINREYAVLTERDGSLGFFYRHFEQGDQTVTQRKNDANGAAWDASPGLNADLVRDDATHYRVIFHKSNTEWTFTLPSAVPATGWLSKINDGMGNNITYAASANPLETTSVTDTTGQRSVNFNYGYNGYMSDMSESLAAGATGARSWNYGYTGTQLTTYTDPANQTTRYCYTSGLLTKIITPRGSASGATCATTQGTDVTDIAYDSDGKVTSVTYENGTAAAITVSFAGASPAPGSSGSFTTETDPYNQTTTYHYDTRDRTGTVDSPMGYHASASFNTNNDVTAVVDPNSYTGSSTDPATKLGYDENGTGGYNNLTSVSSPEGVTNSSTYNDSNNPYQPDTATNDLGTTTTYARNNNGQITSANVSSSTAYVRHQGDSGVANCGPGTAAAYTGAICETRDDSYASTTPNQHRTLYSYDALGEMVKMTPPAPASGRTTPPAWTYTYDSHSRLASKTDARGDTTSYSYDSLDRLTKITYNSGQYTTYTYDEDGDLTAARDYTAAGAQITGTGDTRTYDNLNRLITDTQSLYATTTQTWDADSRLLTVNDGSTTSPITYGYNPDGHLTSMTEPGGSCYSSSLPANLPPAGSGCILFDVDRDGNRLATYYPGNQVREQWTYNTDGMITGLVNTGTSGGASTTFDDHTFDYNDVGGSTQTSHLYTDHQNAGSGSRQHYHYGVTGRFTEADQYDNPVTGGTQTGEWFYCYFDDNNLKGSTTTVGGSCPSANTFDGANQQLGSGHSYDLNGDETSNVTGIPTAGTTRTSTWTDSQQLATVSVTSGVTLNNTYAGPSNDRLLTSDTSATGQDQLRYDSRGISEVTHTDSGTQTSRYHVETDPNGSPIALRSVSSEYYLLVDQHGSIVRMVDGNGITQDAYHYTPYGQRIADTNTLPQPLGYLASYTNSGTGLVHLGARWYDPDQGVFTQPDPQNHNTDPLQDNPYRYASNDPINNEDRSGKGSVGGACVISGSVAAIGSTFAVGPESAPVSFAAGCAAGAGIAYWANHLSEPASSIAEFIGGASDLWGLFS